MRVNLPSRRQVEEEVTTVRRMVESGHVRHMSGFAAANDVKPRPSITNVAGIPRATSPERASVAHVIPPGRPVISEIVVTYESLMTRSTNRCCRVPKAS